MSEVRRGRRTKEEEFEEELRRRGISLEDLPAPDEIVLPDDLQMLAEFKAEVYKQMQRGELKGTSLINALRLIDKMAEDFRAANPPEIVVDERGLDEILADAGLPAFRRVEIGRQEIERLRDRASDLQLVVARIEGDPSV